jgi:hypothetical protein
MLDIRIPIGLLFTLLGAILVIYGITTYGNLEMYHKSLNININLISGLIVLVFGVSMLAATRLTKKK